MDQLKHYLRILKRQHFWVVSVAIVLVGIAAWFWTVRSLSTERGDFQTSIDGSYSTVEGVRRKQDHVNQDTQDKMTQLIADRRNEVKAAWDRKFKQQTGGEEGEEDILKWPEELGPQFLRAVEKFRPIEEHATYPVPAVDRDIATNLRENYRDYVKNELPKLAERIGAVWRMESDEYGDVRGGDEGEGESRGFGRGGSARDSATIVYWNPDDQQLIQSQHFDWTTGIRKRPSSLQVLYAQEDLWVLTALVDIIKRTNGKATVRHNAAVKQIESVKIGKHAGGVRGKIRRDAAAVSEDESTENVSDERDWTEREEESSEEEGDGPSLIDPAEGRYVDKNYQQLGGFLELQGYLASEVAKRMPVRMRVKMDQRAIRRLLIECANSRLTVEVRQVRVNPQDGATGSTGLGRGLLGGQFGGEPDFESRGGLFGQRGLGMGADMQMDDAFPYDVTVELYGIIYIYNPVDEETLGDSVDADSVAMVTR